MIDNGLIKDLSGEDFISRLSESSRNCVTYNDGVYGVALDQMANVVFYNKDIFDEQGLSVPTTYSEFIETCEALKSAGITPCAAGYRMISPMVQTGIPFIMVPSGIRHKITHRN